MPANTALPQRPSGTLSFFIRWVSWYYLRLGNVFVSGGDVKSLLTAAFNGAGDPWTPTWINVGCFWAFELPVAWLLAIPFGLGPTGVWLAITIAFSAVAVVAVVIFCRGAWKLNTV